MVKPLVSVVVPTRDRPRALSRCLAALEAISGSEIEIVVVDDGSSDPGATAQIAAGRAALTHLGGNGPAAARNAGVDMASGSVVCFLDDDCQPRSDWIERMIAPIERADADVVVGGTVTEAGANAATRAGQAITNHLVTSSLDAATGAVTFGPTCNLAVARGVAAALPFDPGYPAAAGEDRDWCDRALASGLRLRYEPTAVVVHRPDLDLAGFVRQQVRYGRGARRYRTADRSRRRLARPAFYRSLIGAGFRRGIAVGSLVLFAQMAVALGDLAEFAAAGALTSRR